MAHKPEMAKYMDGQADLVSMPENQELNKSLPSLLDFHAGDELSYEVEKSIHILMRNAVNEPKGTYYTLEQLAEASAANEAFDTALSKYLRDLKTQGESGNGFDITDRQLIEFMHQLKVEIVERKFGVHEHAVKSQLQSAAKPDRSTSSEDGTITGRPTSSGAAKAV